MAVDTLLVRILFPTTAVGLALLAEARGFGLFNVVALPAWVAVVASVVILDLAIYLQHVLFHAVPALWRLHRMHHADLEFDVTTGLRFHPIEILLSMLIKFAVVAALGAPALAVLIFEVLLNATSMFNHGNVRIPAGLDRVLRWLVVTPDMHRVHHSILSRETNSNFGFNLPWWDRLFGTYRAQPAAGHEAMTIGIEQFRDAARARARPHAAPALPRRRRPLSARISGGRTMSLRRLLAATCACAAAGRSGGVGLAFTATRSTWRRLMLGWARLVSGRRSATWSSTRWRPSPSFPARSVTLAGGALFGPILGQHLEPCWRHAWRHACLPGRALSSRRTGSNARPAGCSSG